MMKEKGIALIKIARLLVGIVFVAGLISIALFPFDKRNLSLQFMTKEGKYEVIVNNDEIAQGKWQYIDFADGIKIEELRIYGKIKSMFLEKIKYDQYCRHRKWRNTMGGGWSCTRWHRRNTIGNERSVWHSSEGTFVYAFAGKAHYGGVVCCYDGIYSACT